MRIRSTRKKASDDPGSPSPERRALDDLFVLTYEELRRLASLVKRNSPDVTLNPTSLVHEAWLKLAQSPQFAGASPLHFKRIAARAMRQVLVDLARYRQAAKRGRAHGTPFVTFDESVHQGTSAEEDMLVLNEALDELKRLEPRQALLVEGRFFGGLNVAEIAHISGTSEVTVLRDWRAAKAWLHNRLQGEQP
jgi:RNA polymerase sigma factor (TIGR02999 family)